MARTNASMFAFNRGEVSKAALARVDNERLRLAAECQLNWMPTVVGEMTLRTGMQMINEIYNDAAGVTLPFVFSKADTALIELTPAIMRVEVAGVLVSRVAVATVVSDPLFAGGGAWSTAGTTAGAFATVAGGCFLAASAIGSIARVQQTIPISPADFGKEQALRIVVANGPVTVRGGSSAGTADMIARTVLDTGTHSLAFTSFAAVNMFLQIESADAWQKVLTRVSIEPAGVMALPTPWNFNQLQALRFDQSGDIVYCTTYGLQPYKIERRGTRSWSVVLWRPSSGPFSTATDGSIKLALSATRGAANLVSNLSFFAPGCAQQLVRMFTPGQYNPRALAAGGAFSKPVRVTGVGDRRNYAWTITGVWVGTISFQRSFEGPDLGFTTISTIAANGTINSTTGGTGTSGNGTAAPGLPGSAAATPSLDNVVCWERVGFESGNYTSGVASVVSTYAGGGGYGLARILVWDSPLQVEVEVLEEFTSTLASDNFEISDWSDANGWPTSVAIFEGRVGMAPGAGLALSQSDALTGFSQTDLEGNDLGDSGAIIEAFGSGPVDSTNWLLPLTRLLCGREQTIESVRASSFDQVLTPATTSAKPCSTHGAARAKAIRMDTRGIFLDESGARLYELAFMPQAMDYLPSDLTRLNGDILQPGVTDIAIQRQRDTHVWLPKNDGQAAVLLRDVDDEITCFWRVQTLGMIENVCVLPAPSGPEHQVFLTVRRVIDGVVRRFREKLAPRQNCIGGTINQLFDCHYVYQGTPVLFVVVPWLPNSLVGVWADGAYLGSWTSDGTGVVLMPDETFHSNIVVGLYGHVYQGAAEAPDFTPISSVEVPAGYNGYPAEVFADGRRIGVLTVAGGLVTLPAGRTAANITACLGYVAPFMGAKLAYAAEGGTAINQLKKIDHVGLLLLNTSVTGLQTGQRFDKLDPLPVVEQGAAVPAGTIWDQYDQQLQEVPGQWDTDARFCMLGQAPYPATVNGVVISIATNG